MGFPARSLAYSLILTAISGSISLFAQDIPLPKPQTRGQLSLEEAIAARRSSRAYSGGAISLQQLSQILWAAQGITSSDGKRAAPSAMHVYPLELYVAAPRVDGLPAGSYRFIPKDHSLARVASSTKVGECLMGAAGGQQQVGKAAIILVFTSAQERTTRFGARAPAWVGIEVGAAAQNVYLQTTSMNLGTVIVGAADATKLRACMSLAEEKVPVVIMPVGTKS